MRAMSTELAELLNSGRSFKVADVYELAPRVGDPVRVTSADIEMDFDGFTWRPAVVKRTRARWVLGLEVDTLKIEWTAGDSDLVNSVHLPQAINRGLLDGATLRVWRIFMDTWGDTSAGGVLLFSGLVGQCEADDEVCMIPAKSHLVLLDRMMPRDTYKGPCGYRVFDDRCGLDGDAWRVGTTALSGSTRHQVIVSTAEADGYYALGRVLFSSGQNNGFSASIRSHVGGVLKLATPLVSAPAPGDQVFLYPGCDNLESTCTGKFGNGGRFPGCMWIPNPESAL